MLDRISSSGIERGEWIRGAGEIEKIARDSQAVDVQLLTIRGERKFARDAKELEFMEQEVAYGVFQRTLVLPEGVAVEKLTAEYVHGVLEITAPMAVAIHPRKIEIKATEEVEKQIAA